MRINISLILKLFKITCVFLFAAFLFLLSKSTTFAALGVCTGIPATCMNPNGDGRCPYTLTSYGQCDDGNGNWADGLCCGAWPDGTPVFQCGGSSDGRQYSCSNSIASCQASGGIDVVPPSTCGNGICCGIPISSCSYVNGMNGACYQWYNDCVDAGGTPYSDSLNCPNICCLFPPAPGSSPPPPGSSASPPLPPPPTPSPSTCPYFVTAVKMKIKGDATDEWKKNKTIYLGQTIRVAGFHNNSDTPSTDVNFRITPPSGGNIQLPLEPGTVSAKFTPTLLGEHTILVRTLNWESYPNCRDEGILTVNVAPSPTPNSSNPTSDIYSCLNIKAYKIPIIINEKSPEITYPYNWIPLYASDLAKLKQGDVVKFAVLGNLEGEKIFSKARFFLPDSTAPVETTQINPFGEYYVSYTIPANKVDFSIGAEIYSNITGRWY